MGHSFPQGLMGTFVSYKIQEKILGNLFRNKLAALSKLKEKIFFKKVGTSLLYSQVRPYFHL